MAAQAISIYQQFLPYSFEEERSEDGKDSKIVEIDGIRMRCINFLAEFKRTDSAFSLENKQAIQSIRAKTKPASRCCRDWTILSVGGCLWGFVLAILGTLINACRTYSDALYDGVFLSVTDNGVSFYLSVKHSVRIAAAKDEIQNLQIIVMQMYLDLAFFLLGNHAEWQKNNFSAPLTRSPVYNAASSILRNKELIKTSLDSFFLENGVSTLHILNPLFQAAQYVVSGTRPSNPLLQNHITTVLSSVNRSEFEVMSKKMQSLEERVAMLERRT